MDNDDLEKWAVQAQETLNALSDEKAPSNQPRTSFFTNSPAEADYRDSGVVSDHDQWTDIYRRALEVDYSDNGGVEEGLLTEGDDSTPDGYDDRDGLNSMNKDKVNRFPNPQNPNAIGPDAGKEYDGPMRVTQNWSHGKELTELDELKHEVEALEREAHKSDVLNKGDATKLYKQLEGLRTRMSTLSEKMQSQPGKDVT